MSHRHGRFFGEERIFNKREGKPETAVLQFAVDQTELRNVEGFTVNARNYHVSANEQALGPEG